MRLNIICLFIAFFKILAVTAQSYDTLPKIDTDSMTTSDATLKKWESTFQKPIKDSNEYKVEVGKLIERIKKNEVTLDELDMIQGPVNFYKRIEKQGGKATERDKKFAKAGIQIIDKREWQPDLKEMALKARRILVFIECCL